jgi:hypothetical protein
VAEGNGLLNRRRGKTSTEGSNPSLSATACCKGSLRECCIAVMYPWGPMNPPDFTPPPPGGGSRPAHVAEPSAALRDTAHTVL